MDKMMKMSKMSKVGKKTKVNTQGWEGKGSFMKNKNAKLPHQGKIKPLGSMKKRQPVSKDRGQFD